MATAAQKRSRRRLLELAGICLAVAVLGWFWLSRQPGLITADYAIQDRMVALAHPRSTAGEFVFVAIDDPSLKLDQLWPEDIAASPTLQVMSSPDSWPWPRSVWADAIEKILAAGARVVMLDLIFDKPRSGDEILKRTLDAHPRQVVLGFNFTSDALAPDHRDLASYVPNMPASTLIEDPANDPRVGFVNFWPTPIDQVVRAAPYGIYRLGQHLDSFGAAALKLAGKGGRIPASNILHPFRFADQTSIPTISFFSLFVKTDWQHTLRNGEIFRDKIVMIGPSATVMHDEHLIPSQSNSRNPFLAPSNIRTFIPGPLLHVNAMAAALHGDFYERASALFGRLVIVAAAALALVIALTLLRHPITALLALVASCVLYLGLSLLVAAKADYVLPFVPPTSVLLIAGVACIAWNFGRERRESGRMRSTLERYVSRNVVREILDNRDDFLNSLGGTRRPVTIFFSDVRGFTSFSERQDAHAVVEQLNEYLGEMVGIIFRHEGTVDKFMGDGIMAVWGNVVSHGEAQDAAQAINAALVMLERLAPLNERWVARGLPPFAIGIGLHHGEAVFGNIGSSEKMEPTVIGDAVNLTSRVEGLTKKYGVTLCVTQPLAELVPDRFIFRTVDLVQVVGKSRPVEILTVIGRHGDPVPDWIKCYEGGVADYRARRFVEAVRQFRLSLETMPDDKLCKIHLARSEAFLVEPPPEDWSGTEIATSK